LLVTTLNSKGAINCAPFAWATPLSMDPPILLFAPWYESHTFANIKENKEFVVNMTPYKYKKEVEICAKEYPEGENELEHAKLAWHSSNKVKPPRVDGCLGYLECRARNILKEKEYSAVIADVLNIDMPGYDEDIKPRDEVLMHIGGNDYFGFKGIEKKEKKKER
ncbi:MAG: flavin reductase family protein, partial [Thermoplasmata archaeon]